MIIALLWIMMGTGSVGGDVVRAAAFGLQLAMSQIAGAPRGEARKIPDMPQGGGREGQAAGRPDLIQLRFEHADIDGTRVRASDVELTYGEYTVKGGLVEGDMEDVLQFTGQPSLTYRGQTLHGDTIRFYPKTREYRVENLRTALSPDFLRGYATAPVYLTGGSVAGRENEPIVGSDSGMTTCDRTRPHYEIMAGAIEVEPGSRITLRRAAVAYQNRRLFTLPTVVVSLGRRLPRSGYQPYVGRSVEEGWFVKTGFNYMLNERAPGMYRVDLMERKGIGLGIEQSWNTPSMQGEATLYGIPAGGQGTNLSGRLQTSLRLSEGQQLDIGYDTRQNDYRTLPGTREAGWRLGYGLRSTASQTSVNLSRRSNQSGTYSSSSETAAFRQQLSLNRRGSLSFDTDYSRYESGASGGQPQITERMSARFQGDYRASNYALQLAANRNVPVGKSTGQSYFGGVERLPEVSLSQFRFNEGTLSRLPLTFNVGAGRFSEGGFAGVSATSTERVAAGFDITSMRTKFGGGSELNFSGGFLQYLYGGGAAQYILRGNTSYMQRWGGRSGLNLRHTYQQPHGGTPFRFDRQGKYHSITGDIGWFDDPRLQFSARFGYDLAGASFGGGSEPWQTVSANLLVRPSDSLRMRTLFSFNPNNGQFASITNDLRIRGPKEFALDIVSRYDPRRHRFGQVHAYLNVPVLPAWRAIFLTQYNGYLRRFESRNIQIIHDMHCLEASLTFIDNPYGWRADRQVMFQLRVKAFPMFQQFGTGQYGQALDTGVGGDY